MRNITNISRGSKGVAKEQAKEFLLKGENVCIIARKKVRLEKIKEKFSKLTKNDDVSYT